MVWWKPSERRFCFEKLNDAPRSEKTRNGLVRVGNQLVVLANRTIFYQK